MGSLSAAAMDGDMAALDAGLAQGLSVDAQDADGCSALHWAADKGQIQVSSSQCSIYCRPPGYPGANALLQRLLECFPAGQVGWVVNTTYHAFMLSTPRPQWGLLAVQSAANRAASRPDHSVAASIASLQAGFRQLKTWRAHAVCMQGTATHAALRKGREGVGDDQGFALHAVLHCSFSIGKAMAASQAAPHVQECVTFETNFAGHLRHCRHLSRDSCHAGGI